MDTFTVVTRFSLLWSLDSSFCLFDVSVFQFILYFCLFVFDQKCSYHSSEIEHYSRHYDVLAISSLWFTRLQMVTNLIYLQKDLFANGYEFEIL